MNEGVVNPYRPPESNVEVELSVKDLAAHRKKLVPRWIRFFGWIFIIAGMVSPLGFVYSLTTGQPSNFSLLGLQSSGNALSITSVVIITLFVTFAISAYGLLFGRDWGVNAALVMGYIGLAVALYVTVVGLMSGVLNLRLEPLIQIPYLIKLHKIKPTWW